MRAACVCKSGERVGSYTIVSISYCVYEFIIQLLCGTVVQLAGLLPLTQILWAWRVPIIREHVRMYAGANTKTADGP